MKEVIAVVRMNMMNRTKAALSDAGIAAYLYFLTRLIF